MKSLSLKLDDNPESDQVPSNKGIREVPQRDPGAGQFIELEDLASRRDPEESRYNEAGSPQDATQGDLEMAKIANGIPQKS